MTENETIKKHIEECEHRIGNILGFMVSNSDADTSICEENITVLKIAIQALEEIQQYKAIGTIEEFKDLKEKEERFDRNIKMFNKIGLEIRNKAIDELKNKICMHFADWKFSEDDKVIKDIIELASESVDEIAEEMRGAKHEKN